MVTLWRVNSDTKKTESVRLEPHPPYVMPSAIEARHWGATYALYRVRPIVASQGFINSYTNYGNSSVTACNSTEFFPLAPVNIGKLLQQSTRPSLTINNGSTIRTRLRLAKRSMSGKPRRRRPGMSNSPSKLDQTDARKRSEPSSTTLLRSEWRDH